MGRSVLLLLALAAAEPRRLLVVDFSRSARTDYGLDAALRHRNLRVVFPDVDYLDIEAELGGAELDRVPALLRARVAGAAAVLVKSNWYYVPDEFMRTFAADWGLANVALQVAGSQPPPWLDRGLEALQAGAERSLGVSPDSLRAARRWAAASTPPSRSTASSSTRRPGTRARVIAPGPLREEDKVSKSVVANSLSGEVGSSSVVLAGDPTFCVGVDELCLSARSWRSFWVRHLEEWPPWLGVLSLDEGRRLVVSS